MNIFISIHYKYTIRYTQAWTVTIHLDFPSPHLVSWSPSSSHFRWSAPTHPKTQWMYRCSSDNLWQHKSTIQTNQFRYSSFVRSSISNDFMEQAPHIGDIENPSPNLVEHLPRRRWFWLSYVQWFEMYRTFIIWMLGHRTQVHKKNEANEMLPAPIPQQQPDIMPISSGTKPCTATQRLWRSTNHSNCLSCPSLAQQKLVEWSQVTLL